MKTYTASCSRCLWRVPLAAEVVHTGNIPACERCGSAVDVFVNRDDACYDVPVKPELRAV